MKIHQLPQATLDEGTDSWGVMVERVEVKDVRVPEHLQRAMAAEAEATREAKAKVIAAEGEHEASRSLRQAAGIIGDSQAAVQVRIGSLGRMQLFRMRWIMQNSQKAGQVRSRSLGLISIPPIRAVSPVRPVPHKRWKTG